jgi:hypothetical protein
MISAEQFQQDFGPEPVFDEPLPPADAPAHLHESYASLKETFDAMHARWLELRRKWVWPN